MEHLFCHPLFLLGPPLGLIEAYLAQEKKWRGIKRVYFLVEDDVFFELLSSVVRRLSRQIRYFPLFLIYLLHEDGTKSLPVLSSGPQCDEI